MQVTTLASERDTCIDFAFWLRSRGFPISKKITLEGAQDYYSPLDISDGGALKRKTVIELVDEYLREKRAESG